MHFRQSSIRQFYQRAAIFAAFIFGCLLTRPVRSIANNIVPAPAPGLMLPLLSTHPSDTTISPKALKAYEGYYTFQFEKGTDSYIHIAATEKGLVLKQMWDGKEIAFTPQTALDFVGDDGKFPLKFTKEKGKFTHVLAFNRDLWTRADHYKPPVTK